MEIHTGELRGDIQLIRPDGEKGNVMLFDPVSESYFRISPHTALILRQLDRDYLLEDFLNKLKVSGFQVEQEELLGLIAFLRQNNLSAYEFGYFEMKKKQLEKVKKETWFLRLASAYMFFKLPAWHPDHFLKHLAPYVGFLSSRWMLWILGAVSLIGYLAALRDFSAVRTTFLDSLSWVGLVKYFGAIVVLKVVHESSHALAAMHFRCRVRAFGVSFIVFYPRLFTDTTDSWRLPRRVRLLIDAAGLLGELLLGGVAALLWCYLPPGYLKSTMFYIFAVSFMSSLLVNGNPLIRYDGYYIVCDLLNAENLMVRSTEYIKECWRYWLLRLGKRPQEKRWMLYTVFGIAAFLYKIVLYTSIILMIYNSFVKTIAVGMLFLEVYTIFLYPMYREFKTIQMLSRKAKSRAGIILGAVALAVLLAVLFSPLSWSIVLPGETRPFRHALVTVPESGFLQQRIPDAEIPVKRGEALYTLASPRLDFSIGRQQGLLKVDRLLYAMQQLKRESIGDSMLTAEKLRGDRLILEENRRRQGNLTAVAPFTGTFLPHGEFRQGMWLPQGAELGELACGGLRVVAYANDREVCKLSPGVQVEGYVQDSCAKFRGQVTEVNPIAAVLRNSPLLQHFGGPIPVYVDEKHPGEYISVQPLYRVDILPDEGSCLQLGRIVRVKILRREILAQELGKFLLSIFRKEF